MQPRSKDVVSSNIFMGSFTKTKSRALQFAIKPLADYFARLVECIDVLSCPVIQFLPLRRFLRFGLAPEAPDLSGRNCNFRVPFALGVRRTAGSVCRMSTSAGTRRRSLMRTGDGSCGT